MLVHPFPMDSRFWQSLRSRLNWPGEVIAPDLPGFGAAPRRPGWSIDDAASELLELLRTHADGSRGVVCGLSMGGYVALAAAAREPERLAAVVLADTRAEADTDEARAARHAGMATIRTGGTAPFLAELLPRLVAGEHALSEARPIAEDQGADALIDALSALAQRPSRVGQLARMEMPARVIVGGADAVTPLEAARSMADRLPRGQLHVLPGAGHLSAIDAPEAFAAVLHSLRDELAAR